MEKRIFLKSALTITVDSHNSIDSIGSIDSIDSIDSIVCIVCRLYVFTNKTNEFTKKTWFHKQTNKHANTRFHQKTNAITNNE